eukprot:m.406231 g.406231  ORF g.406231 m.406231 type:complete len:281 (+) comp21213_c0_seq17:362-1204(+)
MDPSNQETELVEYDQQQAQRQQIQYEKTLQKQQFQYPDGQKHVINTNNAEHQQLQANLNSTSGEHVSHRKNVGYNQSEIQQHQHETLSMSNILCNTLYSFLLAIAALVTAVGLFTYQWVETTDTDMAAANIVVPPSVPGLIAVSCGLVTYCINAAGTVSECALPWPRYGDSVFEQPSNYWVGAAVLLVIALVQLTLAWLYTIVSCFGCFSSRLHSCCLSSVNIAAAWMLAALIVWGASFPEYAVKTNVRYPRRLDFCLCYFRCNSLPQQHQQHHVQAHAI